MEIESIIQAIDWQWLNEITGKNIETLYFKGDNDWSTEVDLAIEKHLLSVIEIVDPNAAIVSEEAFETSETPIVQVQRHKWFVDPLDGTYNLTLGMPYYGVQLCCWDLVMDKPLLGLIYIPKLGELIAWDSQKPQGIFQVWNTDDGNFMPAKIHNQNKVHNLANALVGLGDFSSSNKASRPFQGRLIQALATVTAKIRLHGSSSIDFHFLCTGRSQAYILFTKRVWEIYPGLALAKGFGIAYECLEIHAKDYDGPLWLIAHKDVFEELKTVILAL